MITSLPTPPTMAPARAAAGRQALRSARLGLTLFLVAEALFFVGLAYVSVQLLRRESTVGPGGQQVAVACYPLRSSPPAPLTGGEGWPKARLAASPMSGARAEPTPGGHLLLSNTLILVLSAAAAWRGGRSIRTGHRPGLVRWLAAASLLGGAFLAGQWLEFQRLGGWRPADGVYNMLFGTLAGLHGLHVVGGLALLAVVLYRAQCGQFSARRHLAVTAATYYWYFVVVVWLAMLATMFLSWSV